MFGMNGDNGCSFFASRNHFGPGFEKLFSLLSELSSNNKEMYGVIYLNNDEDKEFHDVFQVWVIRKGEIEKKVDHFLSPLSEKIEIY